MFDILRLSFSVSCDGDSPPPPSVLLSDTPQTTDSQSPVILFPTDFRKGRLVFGHRGRSVPHLGLRVLPGPGLRWKTDTTPAPVAEVKTYKVEEDSESHTQSTRSYMIPENVCVRLGCVQGEESLVRRGRRKRANMQSIT